MVQDFAKIRPEPLLDKKQIVSPPAWSLLFTGILTGIAVGVFACVLLYLSGNVPPLQSTLQSEQVAIASRPEAINSTGIGADEEIADAANQLQLEFYSTLPGYEVIVNATPVEIESAAETEVPPGEIEGLYMLQIGAFERRSNADSLRTRIEALELPAVVKDEPRTGRTLYLVQSGPFSNRGQIVQAERILNASNIPNTRISLTTLR
ncbi:MAG: SPOR domain-containing protein [Pseudohongiellaceae bacterium]